MALDGSVAVPTLTGRHWWLKFAGYPKNQNKRGHWATAARETKRWRVAGYLQARMYLQDVLPNDQPLQRIRISAVIVRRAIGTADEQGDRDRLKPIVDGIVDAGVVPDDTYKHVTYGAMTECRGPAGLELLIEECE